MTPAEAAYWAVRETEAKGNSALRFVEWGAMTAENRAPFQKAAAIYRESPDAHPRIAHAAWRLERMVAGWTGGPFREEVVIGHESGLNHADQLVARERAVMSAADLCAALTQDAEHALTNAKLKADTVRDDAIKAGESAAAADAAHASAYLAAEAERAEEEAFIAALLPVRKLTPGVILIHPACHPWKAVPEAARHKYESVRAAVVAVLQD